MRIDRLLLLLTVFALTACTGADTITLSADVSGGTNGILAGSQSGATSINVDGATVSQMNRGRTIGLIVGGVAVAAGGFALISVLAGSESDDGFSAN